jgi:ribosomal-protein-alanine N-acetyltransferase
MKPADLHLAPASREHEAAYIALANHPSISEAVNNPKPYTAADYRKHLQGLKANPLWFSWVIVLHGQVIGAINFNAGRAVEIYQGGYWLHPDYWGKGIATKAVRTAMAYLRAQQHAHRIQALVEPRNLASVRVLEKCGFRHEGLLRKFYPTRYRGLVDVHMYAAITE